MKIGVVATSYPRYAGDHAGNFVEAHARALAAQGHDVEVIAAADAGDGRRSSGEETGRSMTSGVTDTTHASTSTARAARTREPRVTRIAGGGLFYRGGAPEQFERTPIVAPFAATAFLARLAREIRARDWDAIVAHWLPCAVAALPARRPILAIAHGGDVHTLRRYRLLRPTLFALRHAQLAVVSEELRALTRPDAIVQPMGIDVARFAAIVPARTTPPTILVVARFVPIKGIDVMIHALRAIRRDVQLVIAGDGPDRDALRAMAAGDPRIHFAGEVDASERDQLLARASVVVVPSRILANARTEGTPMIALEALAANVPVVGSAVGGLRALPIETVTPDDPVALARAIERILDEDPRDLRRHVAHLDWKIVTTRLTPRV